MTTIRHDVDGLRAIAVVIVLLYHAGISQISGGFVGVDVFFVISGFLIIPRIVTLVAEGRFSFVDFMGRRIRRLVPALLPVLGFALIAGTLALGAGAYAEFLDSLLGAAGFVSNYVFLGQSGYFERTVDTLFLLHTWSLGVEFQFYLIAPVVLLLAGGRARLALLVLIAASFALAVYLVAEGAAWAFYGVLPRLWELAIGGMVGLLQPRATGLVRAALPMRLAGLALIAFAALTYSTAQPFPGLAALAPVLGAALIIGASPLARDPVQWVLSSAVMRWIGTRSYSLYLWHWPLLVTVALIAPKQNDLTNLAAVALAFPLAEASYRFVETPVRRGASWRPVRRVVALFAVPVIALGAVWLAERQGAAVSGARTALPMGDIRTINNLGDTARADYLAKMAADGTDGRAGICSLDGIGAVAPVVPCLASAAAATGGARPILVIGDSHARDVFHALRSGLPGQHFLLLHQSSCAPAAYQPPGDQPCFDGLPAALPDIIAATAPRLVVLTSHWPARSIAPTEETITTLQGLETAVLVIGAGPVFKSPAVGLLRQASVGGAAVTAETALPLAFKFDVVGSDAAVRAMATRRGVPFVDRYRSFCDEGGCRAFLPEPGLSLIFWDRQHLTLPAMAWYGRILAADPAFAAYRD